MSKAQRDKGSRIEREMVARHVELGIKAERYPLSGASRFRGKGHDIDVYLFGDDEDGQTPLVFEVKGRKNGEGFALLERWISDHDGLFTKGDRKRPLVTLPWETYERMVLELKRLREERKQWLHAAKEPPPDAISDAPAGGAVVNLEDMRDGKTQRKTHGAGPGLAQRKAGKA